MLVVSFHPEIAGESRVHELFLRDVRDRGERLTRAATG
jgi:glutamine amidotransferase PdxT